MKARSGLAKNKYNLIVAAEHACAQFDHNDDYLHIAEIDNGASQTLFRNLAREIAAGGTVSDNYVLLLLSALEMVHRCPSKFVRRSVKQFGADRLWDLLCRIVERYVRYPAYCQEHASVILARVGKLFLHCAKADGTRNRMSGCQEIVRCMTVVLRSGHVEDAARVEAVAVLAELAYTKNCDGVVIHVEGLIDGLVGCRDSPVVAIREGSARALLNLSTALESRQILGWRDDTIAVLLSYLDGVESKNTRKCAIGALGNISTCDDNKVRMCNYRDGRLADTLIALVQPRRPRSTVGNLRKDALSVLQNLCSADTARLLCDRPHFLRTLASLAAGDDVETIRADAVKLLRRLSACVDATSPCYRPLVSALFRALKGPAATQQKVVTILKDHAVVDVNRPVLAKFPGLLDALGTVSLNFEEGKANAIRAILYISYLNDGLTFRASEMVLNALTEATNLTRKKDTVVRFEAIQAIKQLATREANRQLMVQNSALLVGLKWTIEKTTKMVTFADTLIELFTSNPSNPVDIMETILDVLDGENTTKVRDEDLSGQARFALKRITGREKAPRT